MTEGNNKIEFEALKARRENQLAIVVVGGGPAKGTIVKRKAAGDGSDDPADSSLIECEIRDPRGDLALTSSPNKRLCVNEDDGELSDKCLQMMQLVAAMEGKSKSNEMTWLQEKKELETKLNEKIKKLEGVKEQKMELELNKLMNEKIKRLEGEKEEVEKKLFHECWRGESYLGSVAGRGHASRLQESAVEGFKISPEFEKACMARALALWDDVVKDCQAKLRDSGLAWDDVIKLLG